MSDQILAMFLAESELCLAELEAGVEALSEGVEDREARLAVVRGAHTVKGNAALMGFCDLVDTAASLEKLARALLTMDGPADADAVAALGRGLASLRQRIQGARSNFSPASA